MKKLVFYTTHETSSRIKRNFIDEKNKKNIKETGKSTDKFHLIFEGKISRNATIDECINNTLIVMALLRHSHNVYIVYYLIAAAVSSDVMPINNFYNKNAVSICNESY